MKPYKKRTNKEIGQHVRSPRDLTDEAKLLPSTKLIYCYLLLYKDRKTEQAHIQQKTLERISGYDDNTINRAIKDLSKIGYVKVTAHSRFNSYEGHPVNWNTYEFPKDDRFRKYERITASFLRSDEKYFSNREKAFIVSVMPFLLREDNCIKLTNEKLSINLGKGFSKRTIETIMSSLTKKGYVVKLGQGVRQFNLDDIMYNRKQIQEMIKNDAIEKEREAIMKQIVNLTGSLGMEVFLKALSTSTESEREAA